MDYIIKNIDDELWKKVKSTAALRGQTIKDLIITALVKIVNTPTKEGE